MKRLAAKHQPWKDHYAQRAKKERYPARSVYKLKEAQQKFKLIKNGDHVLDLGCSPGSWLLFAAELTGEKGRVVGIDRKPVSIQIPSHVETLTADILKLDDRWVVAQGLQNRFNVVLSDMAPATTGNKTIDSARSHQLCQAALDIARLALRPGGSFLCKIFQGEEFRKFSDSIRSGFKIHKIFKPRSSRKQSKEIFVVGLGFKKK